MSPLIWRLMLRGSATLLVLSIGGFTGDIAIGQVPEELIRDKNITIVELSPQQALTKAEQRLVKLSRSLGEDHPDTVLAKQQVDVLRRAIAGRDQQPRAAGQRPVTVAEDTDGGTLSLNAQQIDRLRGLYQQKRNELGPGHPDVKRMAELLTSFALGGRDQSPPTDTAAGPGNGGIGQTLLDPAMTEPPDVWAVMTNLLRRVTALEEEVLRLRAEVRRLKGEPQVAEPKVLP